MKKTAKLVCACLLAATATHAQITKPEFEITKAAQGEPALAFATPQKIALGPQEKGWYKAQVKFYVAKKFVTADSVLLPDAELLAADKEIIGKSVAEMDVKIMQAEGRGLYKFYVAIASGYVKGYDVDYGSIPEVALTKIINQKNIGSRNQDLQDFFAKMAFTKYTTGQFTAFVYADDVASFGDPHYRTIVVFRNETMLYCVITRDGILKFDKQKDFREDHTGKYYFFQRAQDKTFEEMRDIAYSFIPL